MPIFILFRLLAGSLDRDRIRNDIESRGGKVLNIDWNCFGPGWFGSGNQQIYDVRYSTANGRIVNATCKTSMFSGVYWNHSSPNDFGDL